ncbi:MAG: hypothetical protein AAGI52_18805, partial [Bacteroidota bacterium]
MKPFALATLALLVASAPALAQTTYEVRQESAPGAGDFDSQPLLGTVTPYDGSTQTAEAYYNRSAVVSASYGGSRPSLAELGTDQASLFFVETNEGLALFTVMGAVSAASSDCSTTTSGPFSSLAFRDDPGGNGDSFILSGNTLSASMAIGAPRTDGYVLLIDEGSLDPIFFELDSGENGWDSAGAGLQVLGDDGAGGNTVVTGVLQDDRRIRLSLANVTIPEPSGLGAVPGWRLLSAPVRGLDVLDLAQINYVGGVPAGTVNAAQYEEQAYLNRRGQLAGNLFHSYTGAEAYREDGEDFDRSEFIYEPVPDTDYTFEPGRGLWWYWYDEDFTVPGLTGIGQSYDLTNPAFSLTATGPVFGNDVTVSFPLATVLPLTYDGDGDGSPDTGIARDYFYMGGNPFSQPFNVDGISATNGTVQALVYG